MSTRPTTSAWIAKSPSSWSDRGATRSAPASGSCARPRPWRASRIPTSSRSTKRARSRARSSWSWSSCAASPSRNGCTRPCRSWSHSRSCAGVRSSSGISKPGGVWPRRTKRVWSTATSSRPTRWSATMVASGSSTSAWRGPLSMPVASVNSTRWSIAGTSVSSDWRARATRRRRPAADRPTRAIGRRRRPRAAASRASGRSRPSRVPERSWARRPTWPRSRCWATRATAAAISSASVWPSTKRSTVAGHSLDTN